MGRNGSSERRWRVPELPSGLYIAATTLIVAATYGVGVVTYETWYALVWGQQFMNGELPDFEAPQAPTPHPLSYVFGAALSLFGATAPSERLVGLVRELLAAPAVRTRIGALDARHPAPDALHS